MSGEQMPDQFLIVGDDGQPSAVVDMKRLQDDALKFMFELAASAGDDPKTDEIWESWLTSRSVDEFHYLIAAVLPMMLSNVLAPALDVAKETTGHDFRAKLGELATEAGGPR